MSIELKRLAAELNPVQTVLFFGSGSSLPSHAPSVSALIKHLEQMYRLGESGLGLSEISGLVEERYGRAELIKSLRPLFRGIKPTGGIVNLPLYNWKSIFTTNYDTLIEQSYRNKDKALLTYTSNYDFTLHNDPTATKLFKLHGTLDRDISDGDRDRWILTDTDYDITHDYRQALYTRLNSDAAEANLLIIGHSLADPHIKKLTTEIIKLNNDTGGQKRVFLFLYERDDNRSQLLERRGFTVCFGGIDELFAALSQAHPLEPRTYAATDNPLDSVPVLHPITQEVSHALTGPSNISAMFSGWPASYADIRDGFTFERAVAQEMEAALLAADSLAYTLVGASGVGKTTAVRQALVRLQEKGRLCWEHKSDHPLMPDAWVMIATILRARNSQGVLFVDDAHVHLQQVNELVDKLATGQHASLCVVLASTRNHWNPRIKSAVIFRSGKQYSLSKLTAGEINRLLTLVETTSAIRPLIEDTFSGFSRYERQRRLAERCEADMFVCLKNIFASEAFDNIILREFANLDPNYQDIYRIVAAMESCGIRVHRQLVMRLLGISADHIASTLTNLTDIVMEYTVSEREGLYGWKGRHPVIVSILTKYKYSKMEQLVDLFDKVIDCIMPSYEIEVRTIREICNVESGLPRITDKTTQNRLLRKLLSVAPGERVPRHRLIRNLIDMGEFEKAETEIRIFEKDFKTDGPVARYKVHLLLERARRTAGILDEDRVAILEKARSLAEASVDRYPDNKNLLSEYVEVGIEIFRRTKEMNVFDRAMDRLKRAEERVGDPEISQLVRRFERLLAGQISNRESDIASVTAEPNNLSSEIVD